MSTESLRDSLTPSDDQISQGHPESDTPLSPKRRKYRRHAIISKWRLIFHRIESALRPWVMRYEKLEQVEIDLIVREVIRENVSDEDIYYRKRLSKAISNIAT
jgi:hypothetical protein